MQGEHALPQPVIEKFAKTGGQLANNLFLLRESPLRWYENSLTYHRQVWRNDNGAWLTNSMFGWYI